MRRGLIVAALLLAAVGAWAQSCPVPGSQVVITPSSLQNGTVNQAYPTVQFQATLFGSASYAWVSSGTIPPGLTFNPPPVGTPQNQAAISGTPTTPGMYSFQVTVTVTFSSGAQQSQCQPYTVTISGGTLTIVPSTLPNGNVNLSYSVALSTSPNFTNATYSWSVSSGQLPTGLVLNPISGLISGTPAAQGTYPFTVAVVVTFPGGGTSSASQLYTVSILTTGGGFAITTTSLPDGTLDKSYSQQLTTNAPTNTTIAWSISSGQLPPGLALGTSTGLISGTPTTAGLYSFVVNAIEQIDSTFQPTASQALSIRITGSTLSIVQTSLPPAAQGSPYSTTLTGTGGVPPYQWSFTASTNTQGLSIGSTTGTISGTPPTAGSFPLTVVLTDSLGISIQRTFSLFVATPLRILTTSLPNGSAGAPYSQTLAPAGGQAPYSWSLVTGPLPPGLQLSTGGVISGTPTANGTYPITVQLADFGGRTVQGNLVITIGPGLTIITASLPDGAVGVAYSQTLTATGGAPPLTWSVTSGTLPAGLALDAASGAISGTPTTIGTVTITVQVTDSLKSAASATLTINIASALTITTSTFADAFTGQAYSQTLATSGGQAPLTFSVAQGTLPQGLSLSATTGTISGTPAATGASSFTVSVTDASKQTATKSLAILVANPLTITTGNLTATAGVAFSVTLAASGGTPPYSFKTSSGNLPAGLQFNPATGAISGTPTTSGSTSIVFAVSDSRGNTSQSKTITVTVNAPPAVTIGGVPSTAPSNTQQPLSVSTGSAPAIALTGTLTLAFASAAGRDDLMIAFCNNSRTLPFTIPAGGTQAVFPAGCAPNVFRTGTTAGTITLTAHVNNGGPDTTTTIGISPAPPVITAVSFQQQTGAFTISATGFSNTGELVSATFHFVPASNNTFATSDFTVQLGGPAATWFQNPASTATGGSFTATFPFTVQGNAQAVVSYTVTLTNARGSSAGVSANP